MIKITIYILFALCVVSCTFSNRSLWFLLQDRDGAEIYIMPADIKSYHTGEERGYSQIHRIRLVDNFYKEDTVYLKYPIHLHCFIGDELYFTAGQFIKTDSEPDLGPMFRFDPSCDNDWTFNEMYDYESKEIKLITTNECNSIELIHREKRIESRIDRLMQEEYFVKYIQSGNKLAHQYLLNENYLSLVAKLNE